MADSNHAPQKISAAEIDQQFARIDGINGSAGHHLEDNYLRDLVRQQLAGEITGDEARQLGRQHLGLEPQNTTQPNNNAVQP